MKIDIVYTWVSCSDPNWKSKKNRYISNDVFSAEQVSDDRYLDNDELIVSLRSIFKHMKFINHIYIITDEQQPIWFKENDKITIIDHKDIIPDQYLPTFNSSVIESFIHKIPGLSEYFIYFNDDFVVGKNVSPKDFFINKKIVVQTTSILPKKPKDSSSDYDEMCIINSQKLIQEILGSTNHYRFRHGPKSLIKSRLEYIENNYALRLSLKDKFRNTPFSLIYTYIYHELTIKNAITKYQKSIRKKTITNLFYKNTFLYIDKDNEAKKMTILKTSQPSIICINSVSQPLLNFEIISRRYPKNEYFEI